MTNRIFILFLCLWTAFPLQAKQDKRTRMIVTTDIGGSDPDDIQSLVHLMVMLNDVKLEGLISQHAWVPYGKGATEVIENVVEGYEQVWPNLIKHDRRFPSADEVRRLVKTGQPEAAMAGVGEGKDTEGSEWIISMVDRKDKRPLWIAAWSGMNTLAQALWKVRNTRSVKELETFVSKIRVYDVLGQDDAGAWIAKTFPQLIYIRNTEIYGWPNDDAWYKKHVQEVLPLGAVYPNRIWATEGDTPSFLYCINNGLNAPEHIDYGGWGGRFSLTKKENIAGMDWVKRSNLDEMQYAPYMMFGSAQEGNHALTRWKEDIHNDFKARMQWTQTNKYANANHHPIAVVNGDKSRQIIELEAKAGAEIVIDAKGSHDPDADSISYQWDFYKEPSSYKGNIEMKGLHTSKLTLRVPQDDFKNTIHIILKINDNHAINPLCAYRRVVININPTKL